MQTRACGCMQEAQIDATLKELDIDLIVLARYMQARILMHTHEPACASPVHEPCCFRAAPGALLCAETKLLSLWPCSCERCAAARSVCLPCSFEHTAGGLHAPALSLCCVSVDSGAWAEAVVHGFIA